VTTCVEAVPPALEAVWKGYFTDKVPGTLVETLNKGLDVLEEETSPVRIKWVVTPAPMSTRPHGERSTTIITQKLVHSES
jgi:hypothetical protein